MADRNVYNLQTPDGNLYEAVDADTATKAVQAGARFADPVVKLWSPESGQEYEFDAESAIEGLQRGGVLVGSRAHKVGTTGKLESFARGALQDVTFGMADEALGGIKSVFSDKTYEQERDAIREANDIAQEANPMTYMGGGVAGSLATAALPVVGLAGKVRTGLTSGLVGRSAMVGAVQGGLGGLGYSREENAADIAKDAALGAGMGFGVGGLTALGSKALKGFTDKITDAVDEAVDPALNRIGIFGPKKSNLSGEALEKTKLAGDVMKELGGFEKLADGRYRNLTELKDFATKAKAELSDAYDAMRPRLHEHAVQPTDTLKLVREMQSYAARVIDEAPPALQSNIRVQMNHAANKALDAETLGDLLEARRIFRGHVNTYGKAEGYKIPAMEQASRKVAALFDEVLTEGAENASPGLGIELKKIDRLYGGAREAEKLFAERAAKELANASVGFMPLRDMAAGQITGAVASMAGVAAPIAVPIGVAGGLLHSAARTVQGRQYRMAMGETIQNMRDLAANKLPRSVVGIQEWAKRNIAMIDQQAPQLSATARKIASATTPADAENLVRQIVPQITHLMHPHEYPSYIDGRVYTDADKLAVNKRIDTLELSTQERALLKHQVNSKGIVDPRAVSQTNEDEPYSVLGFDQKLRKLGY